MISIAKKIDLLIKTTIIKFKTKYYKIKAETKSFTVMKIEISRKFYNELNYRKDIYTLIIILKSQIIAQMDIEYNANQYKEQGNQAYKSADYKKALSLYSKAIEINPK